VEKIIHSLFKITQDVTGFLLKTEFFFLGFNFLKANSHHKNIKKRKVLVACKKSFKHEASKSLFAIGGGEKGRGGGATFFLSRKTRWIMEMRKWRTGTYSCETADLCVCVFFSAMHRNKICLIWYISVSVFQKFKPSGKNRVSNLKKTLSKTVLKSWQSLRLSVVTTKITSDLNAGEETFTSILHCPVLSTQVSCPDLAWNLEWFKTKAKHLESHTFHYSPSF